MLCAWIYLLNGWEEDRTTARTSDDDDDDIAEVQIPLAFIWSSRWLSISLSIDMRARLCVYAFSPISLQLSEWERSFALFVRWLHSLQIIYD